MMQTSEYLNQGPIPDTLISRKLADHHSTTAAGAYCFFLGQVRGDQVDGKTVTGIEYSAYDGMMDSVVRSINHELFEEYPDLMSIYILHSTGLVQSGETSLAVIVSSGHRQQSFAALEKCVGLIKERLPVWKKELYADGTSRWIQ